MSKNDDNYNHQPTESTNITYEENGNEDLKLDITKGEIQNKYNVTAFNDETKYKPLETSILDNYKSQIGKCEPKKVVTSVFPCITWLSNYNIKKDLLYDFMSGLTVSVIHIPHGIAYGILGNMTPIYGLYMAIWPVLVYTIFCTSRHVSVGTFAVVCLMTGKVVGQFSVEDEIFRNATEIERIQAATGQPVYSRYVVCATVTFLIALLQIAMYLFRLGVIANLMSKVFIAGFTCGCSYHVIGVQFKDILGLTVPKRNGNFSLLYKIYDLVVNLDQTNIATLIISIIAMGALYVTNEFIKPRVAKKTKVPIPIELLVVILGTVLSYVINLEEKFDVQIIGDIPKGMPNITMPDFGLMPQLLPDAISICLVSYTITISLGLMLAQKNTPPYEVNGNQELLALGLSNCVGSITNCLPIAGSIVRSLIQQNGGGVTQIASVVSSMILLVIVLYIGPLFESVPKCVLASIIVISLKSTAMQILTVAQIFRKSIWDGFTFLITFLGTFCVSLTFGLFSGLAFVVFSLLMQGLIPQFNTLGVYVKDSRRFYLDTSRYAEVHELPYIKIHQIVGTFNFLTHFSIRQKVLDVANSDTIKFIIIDLSPVVNIDAAGIEELIYISKTLRNNSIMFYITGCTGKIFQSMEKVESFKTISEDIFPSIDDAVEYCQTVL